MNGMTGSMDAMKKFVEASGIEELVQRGVIVHGGGINVDHYIEEAVANDRVCVTCDDHTRVY